MHNYLMIVAYDGSGFSGWQMQQNAGRTVQEELTRVARAVFKQELKMEASGRTDAGVHATGQAVSFTIEGRLRPEKIRHVLNHSLPGDIRVVRVEEKPLSFHARYDATGKTYLFKIKQSDEVNVFDSRYYHYVSKPLNIPKMREAAKYFLGTHDFENFSASNHGKKSTVRTVHALSIREYEDGSDIVEGAARCSVTGKHPDLGAEKHSNVEKHPASGIEKRLSVAKQHDSATEKHSNVAENLSCEFDGEYRMVDDGNRKRNTYIEIKVSGNGFLWKMVRMISQTLIDVGIGAMEPADVKKLFKMKGRRKEAAPACGLYLHEVRYEKIEES